MARNYVSFLVSSFISSFLWILYLLLSFFCLCLLECWILRPGLNHGKQRFYHWLHPLYLLVVMLSLHSSAEVSCFGSSLNQICSLLYILLLFFCFWWYQKSNLRSYKFQAKYSPTELQFQIHNLKWCFRQALYNTFILCIVFTGTQKSHFSYFKKGNVCPFDNDENVVHQDLVTSLKTWFMAGTSYSLFVTC